MAEAEAGSALHPQFVLAELQSLDGILVPIRNTTRVKYVCFDVSKHYLALGATSGDVFMFQRDTSSYVGTVANKEGGSVAQVALCPDENILALATSRGHVLVLEHNAGCGQPQRLQLSYEHKGSCVTCLRWNGAGSRLFAADGAGKVSVLNISSSKAKSLFQSPPSTLMKLDSRVVQLDFAQDRLLASTLTRCYLGDTVREKFTQVGKKLRDGEFGGCFVPGARAQDPVTIYAARPGSRLWEADLRGSVLKTHQFKEALAVAPTPLVTDRSDNNAVENVAPGNGQGTAFCKLLTVWASGESMPFLMSWSARGLYVIDPHRAKVMLWNDQLKDVKDARCIRNTIYLQLFNGEFRSCALLTPEQVVPCLMHHGRTALCAQFLLQNSCCLSSAVFQSTIPPALVFELLDKLDELGEASVAEAVSKALSDACGFDATARPPSIPGFAEPKPKPDRPNLEPSPTIRNHRNGPNVTRDRDALSSPRHVRCHSTEPAIAKAKTPSPKPIRRIPRRGSDPLPPASLSRTASTEKCIPKPKPIKACSPTTSSSALSRVASVPGSRSSSPASTVAAAGPQRSRSRSLEAHRRNPESHLAERPSQLSNLGRAADSIPPVPSLVGIGVGSRGLVHRLQNNNNNNNKTVDSQGHSVEDASPADSDGAPEPGCSASEHGNNNNNRRALGSALRTLPVIPASPLESPMSPLDRVDPEVLASMYAEQDMGYESIYQYLNLYTSSMASGAFNMRGAELAQLGNVADLGKLRETLCSKISNGKDAILKNIRGLESKLKYVSVDQAADLLDLASPLSTVPEHGPADTSSKSSGTNATVTPKDEFWSFLPVLNTNLIEATEKASLCVSDPNVFYYETKLSKVLENWVEVLHSSQLQVVSHVASIDASELPSAPRDAQERSPGASPSSPTEWRLRLLKSVFICDPFRLPPDVKFKARELAMLCLQTAVLGDVQRVASKMADLENQEKSPSSALDGTTDSKLSRRESSASPGSEDASTRCDLSLSMRSSTSEKHGGFHLSDMQTIDSASESAMFQSMSSSYGAHSINLDLRLDDGPAEILPKRQAALVQNDEARSNGAGEPEEPNHDKRLVESVDGRDRAIVPKERELADRDNSESTSVNGCADHDELLRACLADAASQGAELSPSQASQSEVTSMSWMPMVLQTPRKKEAPRCNPSDTKVALFIRCYFHLLEVDVAWDAVRMSEDPCFESWSALASGCCLQARRRLLWESGNQDWIWVLQQVEKAGAQLGPLIGYLALLHEVAPDRVDEVFLKKAGCLTARDVLYLTRYFDTHPSLFLKAVRVALTSFSPPQTLSSVRKYLKNEEVRWEWLQHSLRSCDSQCLKCSCGAPRMNSHKINWPMMEQLKAVLCFEEWISVRSMELCQLHGFWPGYLCSLRRLGYRLEHLVTVIQLGDVELLSDSHPLGLLPGSSEEWRLAVELAQKQHGGGAFGLPTCLFCERTLAGSGTDAPVAPVTTITVESVARRMLESVGFEQTTTLLRDLDLPRGSLSPEFFFASVLLTLIDQQQLALSHRMLSRLESYVWSRRLVTLPPQAADLLSREKQGLAGLEDLANIQMQSLFVEEPESHWGRSVPLLSTCAHCAQMLGATKGAHPVVAFHCGHCFHKCCLPGDFCIACLETASTT
ncbi:uncharacterized protein LOC8051152 [Ixodes scapularis]|uniref:uncharacterized protein LOC8051152 n=1 Tax=Ixodes scapularis TaxID=6945 RepID=UPI001A9EADE5|nr:uncharacterized protein LOC8051152 [Ixodes scapularis]